MKKFLLIFLFLTGIFLLFNRQALSATGARCKAAGGECREECALNEAKTSPDYILDCSYADRTPYCCVQVTPGPSVTLAPGTGLDSSLNMMNSIPGLTCGVPFNPNTIDPKTGKTVLAEDKNKICEYHDFSCYGFIPEDLAKHIRDDGGKIPVVGGIIAGLVEQCIVAQDKVNNYQNNLKSECIYGTSKNYNGKKLCVTGEAVGDDNELTKRLVTMCNDYERTSSDFQACDACALLGQFYSSLGCISLDLKSFISETVLGLGISLGGLFALLCIIYSAFRMQVSRGNPEAIKKAQELLTSCIIGLILIIFSIFILRVIGVDILKIPFFSKS